MDSVSESGHNVRRMVAPRSDQPRRVWPEVVGLIPAAGQAKRLQPFPCSKELFPVGFVKDPLTGTPRPKVAAQYLLEKFKAARISKAFIVIREGKWDIPNYFQQGQGVGLSLAYLVIPGSVGPPDTLDVQHLSYAIPHDVIARLPRGNKPTVHHPTSQYDSFPVSFWCLGPTRRQPGHSQQRARATDHGSVSPGF